MNALKRQLSGCKMVYEIQKQALMRVYFGNETELREESIMSSSKRSTIIVEHLRKQQMWDALIKAT